jgi:hypothetical protein
MERRLDELIERIPTVSVSAAPGQHSEGHEDWIVRIDNNGQLVQSDDDMALIFSGMLGSEDPPNTFSVAVDKRTMLKALRYKLVEDRPEELTQLYNAIEDTRDIMALAKKPAPNNASSGRGVREAAKRVAALWVPVEEGINAGLRWFRDGIGRFWWLSTSQEAAEGVRAFIDLYSERELGKIAHPLGRCKIEFWRDKDPRLVGNFWLTTEQVGNPVEDERDSGLKLNTIPL